MATTPEGACPVCKSPTTKDECASCLNPLCSSDGCEKAISDAYPNTDICNDCQEAAWDASEAEALREAYEDDD